MLSLPLDILARAVMIEGPDFNQIILVERKEQQNTKKADKVVWGDFGIDHILLLVKNVKDNEIFFQDVFAGRVTGRRLNVTTMRVANSTIVLAEPESLGLKRENIEPQNIKKLRYGIDQLGFLYADVRPAVSAAMEKGYKFMIDGVRMNYYGVPTAYVVAVTHSPDGVRCEMVQEEGRKGPRIKVEIK